MVECWRSEVDGLSEFMGWQGEMKPNCRECAAG